MKVSFSTVAITAFNLATLILTTPVKAETMLDSFLSASFSTKISPVTDSLFDDTKKEAFSNASQHFLQKVFTEHDANIKILSVGVFDEHTTNQSNKGVLLDKLRFQQHPPDQELSFSTVIVAQHLDARQLPLMSSEHFHRNVLVAYHEFQDHFLTFLRQSDDFYFTGVDSVLFSEYQSNRPRVSAESDNNGSNNNIMGMSDEALNNASIAVIVICSVLSAVFLFASIKLRQKRKELERNRWMVDEMNLATAKSLEVNPFEEQTSNDDYSFDPLVITNGHSHNNEFFASNQRTSMPSPLFEPQTSKNSYTDELASLPHDTIYAPPGKLGVAIDIFNGQAVVMKIRKGSPITGMLQEGDIILAIDGVDCSCMTPAEVTFLMVKNMERVRRITVVRRS